MLGNSLEEVQTTNLHSAPTGSVRDVAATAIAFLTEGRNAWHSTWSKTYVRRGHVYPLTTQAKAAAERRRRSGSQFYVGEMAGLRFVFPRADVVAIHINTRGPSS